MHILDDEDIMDKTALRELFKDVKVMAKAGAIPDPKKIKDLSEFLDDRIRILIRATKDRNGLRTIVGISKAMALTILKKYTHGSGLENRLVMDKSPYNRTELLKVLDSVIDAQVSGINELWSNITLQAEALTGPDHIKELHTTFQHAVHEGEEYGALMEYVNTDTPLASKVDVALAKKRGGKSNVIVRLMEGHEVATAYDFIKVLRSHNPTVVVENLWERITEIVKAENVSIEDMEGHCRTIFKYARATKDYNTAVKWASDSILKGVLQD